MLTPLALVLLALAAQNPAPAPGTGSAPAARQESEGQSVHRPLPSRPVPDADGTVDEAQVDEQRELRALDDRRRGPDARRNEILRRRPLQPVDLGVEDRSTLDASLRLTQPEMQSMPLGFSRVYVDPMDPTRYVRANGALYAVFDHSEYRRAKKGMQTLVPQGTLFRIGLPARFEPVVDPFADAAKERANGLRSEQRGEAVRIDQRIDLYRGESFAEASPTPRTLVRESRRDEGMPAVRSGEATRPRFLDDESYRRQFFESLRQRSAERERPTTETSPAGA